MLLTELKLLHSLIYCLITFKLCSVTDTIALRPNLEQMHIPYKIYRIVNQFSNDYILRLLNIDLNNLKIRKLAIKVGDKAPDFTLTSFTPSNDPVEYKLSSFNGKKNVLLLFFSQAFTGVCTEEMSKISDGFNEFAGSNAEVFGISVDGTFVQKAFAKDNNIKIPLLSDFNKEVIKKYDVVQENFAHGMKNVSKRAVFLIDKDGVVRYKEITENPGVQVNFDKIKEALKNLS